MRKDKKQSRSVPCTSRGRGGRQFVTQLACAALIAITSSGAGATPAAPGGGSTVDPLDVARGLVEARQYSDALPILDERLAGAPDDARALALRGAANRGLGRLDYARSDYDRLVKLHPTEPEPWFWLATIDRWAGRAEAAVAEYGQAIELRACNLDALKGRALVHRHAGNTTGAMEDLQSALRCKPGDAEASSYLAEILGRLRREDEAEQTLRAAFQGAELEKKLGDLMLSSGKADSAVDHYRKAVNMAPNDVSAMRGLAEAQRQNGDSRAALDGYRGILRIDPQDSGALYWVGVLATRLGYRDEAMSAYNAMLEKKPDDAGALVGKARLFRSDGRTLDAMAMVDQALAVSPDNSEARVLRGMLLVSTGRTLEARNEYRTVLRTHPLDRDAITAMDRIGPERALRFNGRANRSDVIEGLDEAGLQYEGYTIQPSRIRYDIQGGGTGVEYAMKDGLDFLADLSLTREAVKNLDFDSTIYDFNVLAGTAGFDHKFSRNWKLSWYLGGSRYEPNQAGTIDTESHFKGGVEVETQYTRSRFSASLSRGSFIQRGFASDFQFRIFDYERASVALDRTLAHGLSGSLWAGVSHFSDGNSPFSAGASLGWSRAERSATLRYRHDPFPARFFGDDLSLDFIDLDVISLSGRTPIAYGFTLYAEGLVGRYGKTQRTIYVDVDNDGILNKLAGPFENNVERAVRASLSWAPPQAKFMSFGTQYVSDDFDFNTGPYNTNSTHGWSFYAELNGDMPGRLSYSARYARGVLGDERDSHYTSNEYLARLDARLGKVDREPGPLRFSLEGMFKDNALEEEGSRFLGYLTIPF
ncbi:MAG: tetratricopeptide repeat protein [Acidobacteriota bacterium]